MKLNHKLLAEKLNKLYQAEGRGFWSELQRESGTSNLHRIADGSYQGVSHETWLKLHLARPDEIPPPTATNGTFTVIGDGNNTGNTNSPYTGGGASSCNLPPALQELCGILAKYVAPIEIDRLLNKYRKVRDEFEKE